MLPATQEVRVQRFRGALGAPERDVVVVEEPIELRYSGRPVATVMRTPGHDVDLALGYLFLEGWIERPEDVGALELCAREAEPGGAAPLGNVADLIPSSEATPPCGVARSSRPATSSCGICGKQSIDDAVALRPPPAGSSEPAALLVDPAVLAGLPERLRGSQDVFASTGALHAAGLFDATGGLITAREDIGRHNAVDKVVGDAFRRASLPLAACILQVSGRVSFEIVQKAYRAGIPIVAAVSGVSSLAIALAERVGITLAGFVRDGRFAVYSHPGRLASSVSTPLATQLQNPAKNSQ